MRKLALLVLLAASAVAPLATHAQEPREETATWGLVGTGPDGRTLELLYEAGGCSRGDGRVVLVESHETIEIEVRHTVSGSHACPANSLKKRLVAQLSEPVEGRQIIGREWRGFATISGRVPRVKGLSPADATRVLGHHGYHVRTRGIHTSGKVAAQRPRGGASHSGRRMVTLKLTYARR